MHDHELKQKCREIARRDRILRPMRWITFAVILFLILLRDHAILSKPVANVLVCIGCVIMAVAWILWEHNLRCPVCIRHLITDFRQFRMRFFSLPESHVCESCGAHLKFTGRGQA